MKTKLVILTIALAIAPAAASAHGDSFIDFLFSPIVALDRVISGGRDCRGSDRGPSRHEFNRGHSEPRHDFRPAPRHSEPRHEAPHHNTSRR